jgi:hypothetical protein
MLMMMAVNDKEAGAQARPGPLSAADIIGLAGIELIRDCVV